MHNFARAVGNLGDTIEPGTEAITFNVDVVFALGEPGSAR